MSAAVRLDALEDAFLWANAGIEHEAWISRTTGAVRMAGGDVDLEDDPDADAPDDDGPEVQAPDKRDLDLGQDLAMRFMEDVLPARIDEARAALHRPGGWRRFKALLDDAGQLTAWHRFEDSETRSALKDWAESEGFTVVEGSHRP